MDSYLFSDLLQGFKEFYTCMVVTFTKKQYIMYSNDNVLIWLSKIFNICLKPCKDWDFLLQQPNLEQEMHAEQLIL